MNNPAYDSALAIVGMAGRFPLARNLEEFWRNLRDGRCSITSLSDQELREAGVESELLDNPSYVKAAMLLENIGCFDAGFFGFNPREAEMTDPQHRFFLECAWEALEEAGYSPSGCEESIGVWAGASESSYLKEIEAFPDRVKSLGHLRVMLGNTKDHLPTWVSYKLNLKGPSVNVQTACSTSLVAVHMACQSLLNGECDLALAGGVSIHVRQRRGYLYQEGGILAPDGYCRAFDARAAGTVSGNGVGIVVLRRLEDALKAGDRIRAVIRGSAINNDGALKLGYTAPSLEGQARAISEALALADVEPSSLSYVEAHGTGTPLGDPIEIKALTQAFRAKTGTSDFCALGSVKPNIGHLDAAAGIAGLIKAVLALEHGEIPPSLHFEEPNPQIDFPSTPFYVNDALRAWQPNGRLRRAGVSSFGMGGTNAHVILEEAPVAEPTGVPRDWQLLVASAKTPGALDAIAERLANHLRARREAATAGPDIADVAFTLQQGRERFDHRRVWVCRDLADVLEALSPGSDRAWSATCSQQQQPVAFLFPGQGTRLVGITGELYRQEPAFQRTMDRCAEILSPHLGFDLCEMLYPSVVRQEEATARMGQTAYAQPALFSMEYALARLWLRWGVRPQAMIGHSLGEYVAACLAGVFSLEDAFALVVRRGRLMQTLPPGAMLALPLAGEELQTSLGAELSLAAINAPGRCVVSGPTAAIEALEREMTERGVNGRRLRTSHGFHSAMMEPILKEFATAVGKVDRQAPQIPFVSNLSGRWITEAQATDPQYWAQHLRSTVRFSEGLNQLLEGPNLALLEVGPGRALSGFCTRHPDFRSGSHEALASLAPVGSGRGELGTMLRTLGRLWLAGVEIDWAGFHAGERRCRVALPTYPFERRRYLLGSEAKTDHSPEQGGAENPSAEGAIRVGENGVGLTREESFEERDRTMGTTPTMPGPPDRREVILTVLKDVVAELTGVAAERVDSRLDFFEAGVDSLLLIQAVQSVDDKLGVKVSFIQLLEELSDIDRLADYLDEAIPAGETPGVLADLMAQPEAPAEPDANPVETPSPVTGNPGAVPSTEDRSWSPADLAILAPAIESAEGSTQAPFDLSLDSHGMADPNGAVEQIILRQTKLMQQHLEMLRAARSGTADLPDPGAPARRLSADVIESAAGAHHTAPLKATAPRPPAGGPVATTRESPVSTVRRQGSSSKIEIKTFSPYRPLDRKQRGLTSRQQEHLNAFIARYEKRTQKSKQHIQAYRPVLADGRITARFRRVFKELIYPIVGSRSAGSRLWDIDGNEYLDIGMGFGLHHFGHSPDFVRRAQADRLARGLELGPHSNLAGRAAELVCELAGQDRATFCNSGTEAIMCSLRLARTYTRRQKIVIFAGSYHGWSDGTLARPSMRDGELTSMPEAPGVSGNAVKDVLVLPWDSPESLATVRAHAHELAAVMVEPVQSRRPDIQPGEFLKELRRITAETGVVLIFDEMVTGCRLLPGGAQAWFDIDADLVIYGKVPGAGLALGVVSGKSALMDFLDGGMWSYGDDSYPPYDKTVFSGAYFKHPLTMATVVAVLERIQARGEAPYRELNDRTQRLTDGLNALMAERELPITVANCGSLFRFLFAQQLGWSQLFYYHLLDRGLHVSPEVGNCFLSFAHTDAEVEHLIEVVRDSVLELQEGEFLPSSSSARQVERRPLPSLPSAGASWTAPAGLRQTSVEPPFAPRIAEDSSSIGTAQEQRIRFSLYYFGPYEAAFRDDKYDLLLHGARFADQHGFTAVWIPERHFDALGGFSPNPAVIAAALARETRNLQLRAGSVVLPIHHPIRVAEEWAAADNLSKGRVGIAFASGWRPDDFVFAPDAYEQRYSHVREGLALIHKLWRGESVEVPCGAGQKRDVRLFPMPMQERLPTWLTGSSSKTYRLAGELGTGVLTNLQEDTFEQLAEKIALYRSSLAEHHGPGVRGTVTVLVHTLLGDDFQTTREEARQPFYDYLRTHLHLQSRRLQGEGRAIDVSRVSREDEEYLLGRSYEKWGRERSLIGTVDSCAEVIDRLIEVGVDEVSCMVDFGVDADLVLERLPLLAQLKQRYAIRPSTPGKGRLSSAETGRRTPLTTAQKSIWYLTQLGSGAARTYNEAITLKLFGRLHRPALQSALQTIVDRHDALRSTFSPDGEHQIVVPKLAVEVPLVDLAALGRARAERVARKMLLAEAQRPLDLERGPLLRPRLFRVAENLHSLALTTHHLVMDGHSSSVMMSELETLYSAGEKGTGVTLPAPTSFADYVASRDATEKQATSLQAAEEFWLRQFADGMPDFDLPTDGPRPRLKAFRVARHVRTVGPETLQALIQLSRHQRSTLFMTLMSCFGTLLWRITGKEDVVVAYNATDALPSAQRHLLGYRVNALLLRIRIDPHSPFEKHLSVVKRAIAESHQHQHGFSPAELIRKLGHRRDPGRLPGASVLLDVEHTSRRSKLGTLEAEIGNSPVGSKLDLYLTVIDRDGELDLRCDYDPDLFRETTIAGWMECFQTVLENAAAGEAKTLTEISTGLFEAVPAESSPPAFDEVPEARYRQSNLSRYQLLLWIAQRLDPEIPMFSIAGCAKIRRRLDVAGFQRAYQALVDRSDALRTVVEERNGVPFQRAVELFPATIEVIDLMGEKQAEQEVDRRVRDLCRKPFRIDRRLFDTALLKIADDHYAWYLNLHHLIADSWSINVIVQRMEDLYSRALAGTLDQAAVLPAYGDYIDYEDELLKSAEAAEAAEYWRRKLAGESDPLVFYGEARPKTSHRVRRVSLELGLTRSHAIRKIAEEEPFFMMSTDLSLSNLFASLLCTFLRRVGDNRHLSLGVPFHNRMTPEFKETIGLFMLILPSRISVEDSDTFASLAQKAAVEQMESLQYRRFPVGNPLHQRAYEVEFNYLQASAQEFSGSPVEWLHSGYGRDSLMLQVYDSGLEKGFTLDFDFHRDLFDKELRDRALRHYLRLIDAFLEAPGRRITDFSLLSATEAQEVLHRISVGPVPEGVLESVIQRLEDQVAQAPDRPAVVTGQGTLSYGWLVSRVEHLAGVLRGLGVGPDVVVALLAERSVELLTAILAILKAGGAYLPLDPLHPPRRLAQIVSRSGSGLVLASSALATKINAALETSLALGETQVVMLDELLESEAAEERQSLSASGENLGYVIFTSGSTGVPKGAMVTRAGMRNHLQAKIVDLELTTADRVAQTASQCFDISVWQILAPLMAGGEVRLVSDGLLLDPQGLMDLVEEEGITILEIVPSLLRALLEELEASPDRPEVARLRWLLITGEALEPELCRRWSRLYPSIPLLNAYGPTECSDDVTHHPLPDPPGRLETRVPVGRPLANLRVYVLDEDLRPPPFGVAGEVFVGGVGVGRGYRRDPARTAEVFVPDPLGGRRADRLYRTGDRGRYRADGSLEFLGRVDHQVKIRGFRIELGEIEAALGRHPRVSLAVVTEAGQSSEPSLVAYFVVSGEPTPVAEELRDFLLEELPDYMIPTVFMPIDRLPLTVNGKLDRRALPEPKPDATVAMNAGAAPRNDRERILTEIWAEVLGIERVGIHDDFFALGGESILSIHIVSRANRHGFQLSADQIFEHPTIAELAAQAEVKPARGEQGPVVGPLALTPIQRWFFELERPDPHHWNQAVLLQVGETLDSARLEAAVGSLLRHHDALRIRFDRRETSVWTAVHAEPGALPPFVRIDLASLPESRQDAAITTVAGGLQASLRLEGPVLRVAHVGLGGDGPDRLLIVVHHLVIDGVSWRFLLEDLLTAYQQLEKGGDVRLPPKSTAFKDWAEFLVDYAESQQLQSEARLWLEQPWDRVGALPVDFSAGENSVVSAREVVVELTVEETRALLQEAPGALDVRIDELLLAALAEAFAPWLGETVLLVDLESHGRRELDPAIDLSRTVGWFTCLYPVLFDLRRGLPPETRLAEVRRSLRQIPNGGIGYGVLRYLARQVDNFTRRRLPRPEVSFNYLGQLDQVLPESSLFALARESSGPLSSRRGRRPRLLDVNAMVVASRLRVEWIFSEEIHRRVTVEGLALRFLDTLRQLVERGRSSSQERYLASDFEEFGWSRDEVEGIAEVIGKAE